MQATVGGKELDEALRHVGRVREQARAAHQRLRAAKAAQGDTYGTYVHDPTQEEDLELLLDYVRMAYREHPGQVLVVHVAVQQPNHQGHPNGAEGGNNGSRAGQR